MASLYHSSLPFSPPSSSCHGVLSFPPRTAASFACLCRVPPQDDHDAELLGALQSNGNGILLREQHPAASAQPLDPIPGELGDGRRRSSQFRARDCARRIMSLPMEERVKVLDLLQRDDAALTVSDYNDIISALARGGDYDSAVALFRSLEPNGSVAPDAHSFAIAVQCFCTKGAPDEAKETLDEMVARGYLPSVDAKEVFGKVVSAGHEPVSYTYCLMAQALARGGEVDAAVAILDDMVRKGYALRKRAYTDVVRALCDRSRTRDAVRVLATVIAKDFVPGRNAFDALLGELSRQERWPDAMAVYAAALKRGVVVSLKRNVKEALVVDHEEEAAWESPAQLGVPQ